MPKEPGRVTPMNVHNGKGLARRKRTHDFASAGRQPQPVGAVTQPSWLDDIDRKIIETLQNSGRYPFRRLAQQLDVPEATIRYRYARLLASNVLQVVGITNPLGLGFEAMALVGIRVGPIEGGVSDTENTTPGRIADEISGWREASYVVETAGQFDIVVEVVCVDHAHLLGLVDRIRALSGVASVETFVYLRLCKQLYNWGTTAPGSTRKAITRTT